MLVKIPCMRLEKQADLSESQASLDCPTFVVILEILQILKISITVNEDSTIFTELIQMSVEWSNDLKTFLAIS